MDSFVTVKSMEFPETLDELKQTHCFSTHSVYLSSLDFLSDAQQLRQANTKQATRHGSA